MAVQTGALELSPEGIDAFLEHLCQKGRSSNTVSKYRRDLLALYEFLPDKLLCAETLPEWRAWMLEQGYALRTVNSCISAANSFLDFAGRRDLQLVAMDQPEDAQPELTRAEYLRLLSAARALDRERPYLWVKIFGSMGLSVQNLARVTREAVESGAVAQGEPSIPAALRQELLAYADREGIRSGPLFLAKNGLPVWRTYVTDSIRALGRDARVAEEKATPRCLRRMYRATQTELQARIARLVEQSYEHLLETEQLTIGWDEAVSGL